MHESNAKMALFVTGTRYGFVIQCKIGGLNLLVDHIYNFKLNPIAKLFSFVCNIYIYICNILNNYFYTFTNHVDSI